jgi:hypothetical protein
MMKSPGAADDVIADRAAFSGASSNARAPSPMPVISLASTASSSPGTEAKS